MAHYLVGLDWAFLGDITNILLTRHPREMLPSLAKNIIPSLHQPTGFAPYRPKTEPFPDELRPLFEECLPYYNLLAEYAIRG